MTVLKSHLDTRDEAYKTNREAMLNGIAFLDDLIDQSLAGGGEKYVARHRQRNKLLVRERVDLLLDPGSPFLELSAIAGYGKGFHIGGSVVTGIGVISGTECMVLANDPTVKGGSLNPSGVDKILRAFEICHQNRLPMVFLVESGGADLPHQLEIFIRAGDVFRQITMLSAARIPTVALVFGSSTAGGAYLPGMSDYVVMQEKSAKVFLGGPPLVKMATGEDSTDEELGGAEMHSKVSGVSDYLAVDEHDTIRLGRDIVARLNYQKGGPRPIGQGHSPRYDPDELLGIVSSDLKVPFAMREVIARVFDNSELDEFKPQYGSNLITGWAQLWGYPVGILANDRGVLFSQEANKAAQFIQLANQSNTPLIFLQNVTGYMVGRQYEQGGIIKHGSHMINAVANSSVPHLTLQVGNSYGAGNYGMCGRSYEPRFLFGWPSAKTAVMGAEQLAGTLSIVARNSALNAGRPFDEEADAAVRKMIEDQISSEEQGAILSGRLLDDGLIDPRDSRTTLGIALSAVHTNKVQGAQDFGVFRM